tara:strand:+ start:512 stop:814 length:303 start_codon:yes stop_codon:yes gene_type:complete
MKLLLLMFLFMVGCGDSTVTHELEYAEQPTIDVVFPETPIVVRHEFDFTDLVLGFINECEDEYSDIPDDDIREQLVNACITDKIRDLIEQLKEIDEGEEG